MSERDSSTYGAHLTTFGNDGLAALDMPGGRAVLFMGGIPVCASLGNEAEGISLFVVRDSFDDADPATKRTVIDWIASRMQDGRRYRLEYRRGHWWNYLLTVPEQYES